MTLEQQLEGEEYICLSHGHSACLDCVKDLAAKEKELAESKQENVDRKLIEAENQELSHLLKVSCEEYNKLKSEHEALKAKLKVAVEALRSMVDCAMWNRHGGCGCKDHGVEALKEIAGERE